jgi:hypothetical protein
MHKLVENKANIPKSCRRALITKSGAVNRNDNFGRGINWFSSVLIVTRIQERSVTVGELKNT